MRDVLKEILEGWSPDKSDISEVEFKKLLWTVRGMVKEHQRERAFWSATNDNLQDAFMELDRKDQELERAYGTIQADLSVARSIQKSLLPVPTPTMQNELEIAVFHQQLADVGGDYYDFFATKQDRFAVGVFDISGHGVSAALVMTYLKAQFMMVMDELSSPSQIVQRVNEVSLSFMRSVKRYAALSFVVFGPDSLRYVNGGGNGLLVTNESAVQFAKVDQFLGLRPRPFHEHELRFAEGDLLALYTDGMLEAQNESGEDYTKQRLNDLIVGNHDRPVDEILQICRDDYSDFRIQDSDDITLVLMRRRGNNGY